ncbi:MAG: (S)-benzoin forming benzil reductase [Spirochaetes bacterium]|jgi:benzil reductase ((S)-benzoin forming)|nr:(S)-benzoin forming benzil reductase [Spirochaetota bacterium]
MKYAVITGTSSGVGEALARILLHTDTHVICISRHTNAELLKLAEHSGFTISFILADLTDYSLLQEAFDQVLQIISSDSEKVDEILLINNAGTVQPVGPVENNDSSMIRDSINLNLVAPMLLSSLFIREFGEYSVDLIIINISSGAAQKPYEGWSSYCSAKAGLDMFTTVAGKENSGKQNKIKVLAVAPGVVDTPMQKVIRNTPESEFKHVAKFKELYETGALISPEDAAGKIFEIIKQHHKHGNGSILDIREL